MDALCAASPGLAATLSSLLREPLESVGHASARAPYSLASAAGEGAGVRELTAAPRSLLVFATCGAAGAEALGPLFDAVVDVPLLRGAAAVADALRASAAAPIHADAIELAAAAITEASADGVALRTLFRRADRAAALSAFDAASGAAEADADACAAAGLCPEAALQLAALGEEWDFGF